MSSSAGTPEALPEAVLPSSGWRALSESLGELVLGIGPDGRIGFINRVARSTLGYSGTRPAPPSLVEMVHADERTAVRAALAAVGQHGQTVLLSTVLSTVNGARLPVSGNLVATPGAESGWSITALLRPVPDGQTPAEANRRESLAESQIIRNVAREKQLTELKAHFISMASHELRTPLAALSLGVDFLAKYWPKLAPDQINKNLKTVDATVRQLRSVLDSVLIISSEDEGRLRCARSAVELVSFCRRMAEDAATGDDHRHAITVTATPERCEAQADPQLLSHILSNLLSNACKYSPAGQPVEMAVALEGGAVVISVSDHGIGIPPEDRPRLFDLFFRGSNVGNVSGTGLGLVVVRRCVEAHHGTLAVDGVPGGGTRMSITLPLLPPP